MNYRYIPILLPLLISGLTTLSLGIFAKVKQIKARGTDVFTISMFIVTFWSIPNALEMAATELDVKLFWANMQYFAYCLSPVSLLVLCLEFTHYKRKINKKIISLLLIIPCITLLLVWTNSWHGLIRYDVYMDYTGDYPIIVKKYGIWFYVHALYSYFLNLYAIGALIKAMITTKSFYRRQIAQLLLGTCLIVVPNLIYITGLSPVNSDITPIFFGPAGAIILWSIFHSGMFELVPIARTAVIEAMEAGVIVIDVQGRVLDMNPAFKRIAKISLIRYYLTPIEKICKNIPDVAKIMMDRTLSHVDFTIYDNEQPKVYEIIISQLNDKKGNNIGMLGLIYDITDKKLAQKEYAEHQWRMAVIDERERMSRDLHDNLGQVLGFINFQTQAIKQVLVKEGIELVSDKLEQLIIAVQNAHSDMREYISSNRISVNVERDFISSLTNDIERFKQQTGLPVRFDLPEEPIVDKFNSALMANLQNIIREAMNNIRKHAQAAEVRIAIKMKEDFMVVSVADNGKGFETIKNDYTIKNKFGLDIMRERAALIGGSISIESIPNKGSRLMIYVPRTGGNQTNENEGNAC